MLLRSGTECTFEQDIGDPGEVRAVLLGQVERVARRLRRHGLRARGVALKIRYGKFDTITRSATLAEGSDGTADLWAAAAGIWDAWAGAGFRPVRLVGMTASRLDGGPQQGALFPDPVQERSRRLDAALDSIRDRFGAKTVRRGSVDAEGG